MRPYPEYKESGVEWLGEVPAGWATKRLGYYFSERNEKVSDKDFPALSVTMGGIVPQIDTAAKTDDGDNRKLVRAGDFVINSRSDRKGSSGLSELEGSVSLISIVLKPSQDVFGNFSHWLLKSRNFQEEFYRCGTGIVADLWSTRYASMRSITMGMPPLSEQRKIAEFLDREVAKIDDLIDEQRRLIALLAEKRQATISHAVTKGLNPNAKLKPSGIDWLGDVPEGWDVVPFKHVVDYQEGPGIMAADFHDDGIPLIRISGVQGRIATLNGCNYLSPDLVEKKWSHFRLKKGELLISASATMGTVCEVGTEAQGAVAYTGLIRLKPKGSKITTDYIRAFVVSFQFSQQIDVMKAGAIIQHFGPSHLAQVYMVLPPTSEQVRICEYLELISEEFTALSDAGSVAITLLQERRSALISAAVTGKIDLRDFDESILQ